MVELVGESHGITRDCVLDCVDEAVLHPDIVASVGVPQESAVSIGLRAANLYRK